jgi:hypothetical protein
MTMQSAIGGTLIPQMDESQQYRFAAGQMFPGYQDRPYLNRYMSRAQQPLFGQYLTGWTGLGDWKDYSNPEEAGFAGWLQQGVPEGRWGQPMGWNESVGPWGNIGYEGGRMVPGPIRPATPGYTAPGMGTWADIVRTARAMSSGIDPATGGDLPASLTETAYDRWAPMLGGEDTAGALASLATYDPMAGSVFGKLRQAGLQRAQDRFVQGRLAQETPVGTTPADWLAYITKTGGLAGRAYQVGT